MSEENLQRALIKAFKRRGHFSEVESHETSAGIPDIDYCMNGIESHIELKFGNAIAPRIRPSQVKWFRDRVRAGGHPWLFTCIMGTSGKYWMLHKGAAIGTHLLHLERDLKKWQLCSIAMWEGRMDWDELYCFLTTKWNK